MTINEELFEQRYKNLNERQREAVDTIYGAVMVIAGPGTGKTEVLSMRIANLLRSEAQVAPFEILCLTYTDEATNSMRRRLLQIIGNDAHRVHINTFHAFCNNIIQNNSEYFGLRALQPITDLERTELLYEIQEELPQGHRLRRLSGNIYYDAGKLNRLFDFMKREHHSSKDIAEAIGIYLEELPERSEYIYKNNGKGYSKGDVKKNLLEDETRKMEDTRAAAALFAEYEKKMKERGRYDFNDMIIWVINAFRNNPAMLQRYQESYQFILVDEFQDTNGSQNELLNMLTGFWEDPNIFVVGDDDQSIYEFQGARIRNIVDFYGKHKDNIKIIVLPHNYRSSQPILDIATATIKNNSQRLINQLQELNLNKDIVSAALRFKNKSEDVKPVVVVYGNPLQEEADIVSQIETLQQSGVSLGEVAVLYAQHKQAENIIALMERKGIPYNVKKPVNILDVPVIEQIIKILQYLDAERKKPFSAEDALFEIMHAPYFGIQPTDIALLSLYLQEHKRKEKTGIRWRVLLTNNLLFESLGLASAKALYRLGNNLEQWELQMGNLPLPLLVEKIIYESGIVNYLLQTTNHVWNVQVLYTFFEFIKDTYGRNPKIKSAELLQMIERMRDENIAVPFSQVIQNANGVQFYTAHSAKGNEFEYVFLIGCTKNYWEKSRSGGMEYKLPDNITFTSEDSEKTGKEEAARRLFYVALTRAKKHLQISFATKDNAGKSLEHSVFVDEISTPEEYVRKTVPATDLLKHIAAGMQPVPDVRIKLANGQWIERVLQQLTMSATTLSKYLHCPLAFYYENILRVPFQKNDALAFGSAVHYALENFFRHMKEKNGEFPDKKHLLGAFNAALYNESSSFTALQFERRKEQGHTILSDYYDKYINEFHKDVEIEWKVPRYMLNSVPVTGKIDKIEMKGDSCTIIDYKTGDSEYAANAVTLPPNEKDENGGDYWRQMVFYTLIIENYQEKNWRVEKGIFDFIQKNKYNEFKRITIPLFEQDKEIVKKQLTDTYSRIMNHEFDKGCGKEDCHWCNFAKRYELIRNSADELIEIDDV